MNSHFIISCTAFVSLCLFVGCPQTPDAPSQIIIEESEIIVEIPVIVDESPVVTSEPSADAVVPAVPAEPAPPTPPAPEPPAPPPSPEPPQETADERVVRERVAQLGGSIRKNAEGRIDRIIISNNDLTPSDMQAIGKLTSLEWIRIVGPAVTDEYVEALSGLPNLKIVDIGNSTITDQSLELLKTCPEIHTLELQRNVGLTDQAIKLFAEFPKLETLKILYNGFSSVSLFNLDKLKSVRVLDLRNLPVDDDVLSFIADLENLEEIRIRSGTVTNDGLAELARCPNLKIIELQDSSVSIGSAEFFKQMKNLRSLRIFRGSRFEADAVAELGVLTDLETLELREIGCSAEALLALKPLTQLSTVEFSELPGVDSATMVEVLKSYPKLESIRIFAIPVDDSVASLLATIPTLKRVSLPATAITDAGLEALSALSDLLLLDIHGNKTRITLEGATRALGKFKGLRRLIIPETLDTPAFRSAVLENSPRCTFDLNTYSQET